MLLNYLLGVIVVYFVSVMYVKYQVEQQRLLEKYPSQAAADEKLASLAAQLQLISRYVDEAVEEKEKVLAHNGVGIVKFQYLKAKDEARRAGWKVKESYVCYLT